MEKLIFKTKINMNWLYFIVIVGCMFSCNRKEQSTSDNVTTQIDSTENKLNVSMEKSFYTVIKFLGHELRIKNDNFLQEFSRICVEDDNLSLDSVNRNITIYGTTFHINVNRHSQGVMLITSVQPDTRQMRIVRDAISRFHGEENFEEDCHYSWLPYTDSTKIGQNYPIIHQRRVRSEDGGTVRIVN